MGKDIVIRIDNLYVVSAGASTNHVIIEGIMWGALISAAAQENNK